MSSTTMRVWNPSDAPAAPDSGATASLFRGGYRLAEDCGATIAFLGARAKTAMRVIELSPQHVVVRRASGELMLLDSPLPVRLQTARGLRAEFRASIADTHMAATHSDWVLAIDQPSIAIARTMLAIGEEMEAAGHAVLPQPRPVIRDVIDTPERQRWILDVMVRNRAKGTVRLGDFPIAEVTPVRLDDRNVYWQLSGCEVAGPVTIELMGYNTLYVLTFEESTTKGRQQTLVTPLPRRMVRLRNRSYRRASAPAGTRLHFRHPLWPEIGIMRDVREVSANGLSFKTDLKEDLLYPELSADMVVMAGGEAVRFTGEVKSLSRGHDGPHHYCGLRVYPSSARDEERWLHFLDDQLHPRTRTGSRWARATWSLYERAGYFDLSGKDPAYFTELTRAFERTSKLLDASPELGCHVVWPYRDDDVDAGMSMLKTYSSSWMVFQLAKPKGDVRDETPGMTVLRELHFRCYEHAQQRDPALRWLLAIVQVKRVWSRLVHYDLPAEYVTSGKAYIVRCRTLEVPTDGDVEAPSADGLTFGDATPAEIDELLATIAAKRPQPYLDSLDYTRETFALDDIREGWARGGLTRRRAVRVARRDGRAIAAAVLESGDDGLHLFRLLDSVRPYALAEGGEAAFGPLVASAADWFRADGKAAYIAFIEERLEIPPGLPAATQDLGLADLVVLSADRLPELLEHVYAVTAPKVADAMPPLDDARERGARDASPSRASPRTSATPPGGPR